MTKLCYFSSFNFQSICFIHLFSMFSYLYSDLKRHFFPLQPTTFQTPNICPLSVLLFILPSFAVHVLEVNSHFSTTTSQEAVYFCPFCLFLSVVMKSSFQLVRISFEQHSLSCYPFRIIINFLLLFPPCVSGQRNDDCLFSDVI